ncbi:MAG: HD domain-containing phosphohydrolase [Azonexus sp.]|jgi:HD-GYP domain-containing protein (c-di-GMP phosphodiesterase class II)|nr:HD domain-containing phosphohydrolase [Azonexus sp.]
MEIIPAHELKIGMFVVEPDCSWTELPFLMQGFVVSSVDEVEIFRNKCRFVHIDRSRSLKEHFAAPKARLSRGLTGGEMLTRASREEAPPPPPRPRMPVFSAEQTDRQKRRSRFLSFLYHQEGDAHVQSLSQELAVIEPRYDALQQALQKTYQQISTENHFDYGSLREGVRDVTGSLQRNPDAVMWLLHLKSVDEYSFDHAMDVSVHALLLGGHLGWRGSRLLDLGVAGLLQDVGKSQIPAELLTKTDALDASEQQMIHSHVASSLEILMQQQHLSPDILQIVARHHERWDGSGYPRGLRLDQIGMSAEIAGLVDSFCAMLRNKPYRSAVGHQQALEALFRLRDKQFNPYLMEQFVQCVGLYPIGTLVEFNSGEVGVVIQQNRVQRSRPRVLLMLDPQKAPLRGYNVVDLRQAQKADMRIIRALPQGAYGLTPDDYYLG